MKTPTAEDLFETLMARDPRYTAEAYAFVRNGLDVTVQTLKKPRHISGQELTEGLRSFALKEFGPMAKTTLNAWGIERTEDFGEIVFNMIEVGWLGKNAEDRRADFATGYDFYDAFCRPFQPGAPSSRMTS